MATISIDRMEVAKTISGNSPFTMSLPEGASQTFKKGDVVMLNASGHIVVGSPATTPGPARIAGVAAEDGHNGTVAQYNCVVWIACDDTIFRANTNTTTALTQVGFAYGIITSSTKWVVDTSAGVLGVTRRVIVMRLDPRDAVGDTNGRVEFVFHPFVSAFAYTS